MPAPHHRSPSCGSRNGQLTAERLGGQPTTSDNARVRIEADESPAGPTAVGRRACRQADPPTLITAVLGAVRGRPVSHPRAQPRSTPKYRAPGPAGSPTPGRHRPSRARSPGAATTTSTPSDPKLSHQSRSRPCPTAPRSRPNQGSGRPSASKVEIGVPSWHRPWVHCPLPNQL